MNTQTNQKNWQQMTWQSLYDACTPKEREEMITTMLMRIEIRQSESVEVYKRDPGLLTGLSVPALRDVAEKAANDAHRWIVTTYPDLTTLLIAYECLISFSISKDETINYNDLTDIISSLKDVWNSVSTETKGPSA